jgi:TetR/AcrR family transcriptional regulator, fatty acid metabolism regulator protein
MSETAERRQVFRLSRERRVSDLMAAARQVFSEKGYQDTSTAEIAERAGVVEGTIYRYFSNKRDLLIKVVEAWYDEMISDYDEQLSQISGTWNRLRFLIWKHLSVIHKEPALCRFMFTELRADPDYRSTTVFELNRAYTRRMIEIIDAAMQSGEFRSDIPTRMVRDLVFGGVEHHTWSYLRGEGNFFVDSAANSITDMVYRGMAVQPEAASHPLEQVVRRLEAVVDKLDVAEKSSAASPAPQAKRKLTSKPVAKPARRAPPKR